MDWNGLLNFQDDPQRNMLVQVGLGLLAGNQSGNPAMGAMRGFQSAQELINARQRQKFLDEQIRMQKQDQEWQNQQRQRQAEQQQRQQELVGRLPKMLGVNPDVLAAYPELGQKLVERTMFPAQPEVDKVLPDKYTPESLAKFRQSGDYSQLVPVADPAKVPASVQEYEYAKQQGFNGSLLDYQLAQKRAGATNVSVPVNLGQKGFDNTLKLRGDFRSEPIYKAHQEVKSAYSQIQTALKEGTPVGDMAGATKIMKLLDPGSVVRESELGMAMAATGLEDRLKNYANMVITGEKLTPLQRKEFQTLADGLFSESASQYNAKRVEYKDIADRNELNAIDVVGTDEKLPSKPKTNAQALPLPANPNAMNLKKGSVYQTPKGALRWNGKAFEDL